MATRPWHASNRTNRLGFQLDKISELNRIKSSCYRWHSRWLHHRYRWTRSIENNLLSNQLIVRLSADWVPWRWNHYRERIDRSGCWTAWEPWCYIRKAPELASPHMVTSTSFRENRNQLHLLYGRWNPNLWFQDEFGRMASRSRAIVHHDEWYWTIDSRIANLWVWHGCYKRCVCFSSLHTSGQPHSPSSFHRYGVRRWAEFGLCLCSLCWSWKPRACWNIHRYCPATNGVLCNYWRRSDLDCWCSARPEQRGDERRIDDDSTASLCRWILVACNDILQRYSVANVPVCKTRYSIRYSWRNIIPGNDDVGLCFKLG